MGTIGKAVGVRDVVGLFNQLTINLVSQRPQVLTGLKDSLDDWHRV